MDPFHQKLFWTMSIFLGSSKCNNVQRNSVPFLRRQDVAKYGMLLGKCSSVLDTSNYRMFVCSAGEYRKQPECGQ